MTTTQMQTTKSEAPTAPKQPTLRERLEGPDFAAQIAKVLPKHLKPERMVRVALTALMRTPKLKDCDQASFFNAMLQLSQFGLEPDGRRAHLIPYNNKKRGCIECQLIVDYKGLVELAMRSGMVSSIHADVVCEHDEFVFNRGKLESHKIDFKKPRGEVYAVYALATVNGAEKCEVLTTAEVESIRKRSRAEESGPWITDWNEMAKKTAFRRLSKWLPLSADFRDAVDADDDAIEVESKIVPPKFEALTESHASFLGIPETTETPEPTEAANV